MLLRRLLLLLFLIPVVAMADGPIESDSALVEMLNPAFFKKDFATYDQKTALYCAALSSAAYKPKDSLTVFQEKLNRRYGRNTYTFSDVEADATNTRALVCATDKFIVIAFRGTQFNKPRDILTDLKRRLLVNSDTVSALLADVPGGHAGFRKGAANLIEVAHLYDTLHALIAVRGKKDLPIYLTGHSMGAGYASLFVQPIARRFTFGGAYHFAPPLTVYCPDAEDITRKYGSMVHDIVNYKDYVARATPYCRRHMKHIGQFYRIARYDTTLHHERERYVGWGVGEKKLRMIIQFHTLSGYMNALASQVNTNARVAARKEQGKVIFGKRYPVVSCKPCAPRKLKFGF